MKIFKCDVCDQILFYKNTLCLRCRSELGFIAGFKIMSSLEPCGNGCYKALAPLAGDRIYRKCRNYQVEDVCNWMIPAESQDEYCFSCSLTKTIPDLEAGQNRLYWYRLEKAKRQLLYALMDLGLPIVSRRDDPEKGLAFEFLEDEKTPFLETRKVMTGHMNGVITINVAEADDAFRVRMRLDMKEEYRTLLGHFRHEIGHYYWALLVENTVFKLEFREIFGDESVNYTEALTRYYEHGAPANWQASYVSRYCASHPWEDWAETWAHYLHIIDALDTAASWGIEVRPRPVSEEPVRQRAQQTFYAKNKWTDFDDMFNQWTLITCAINSMNRSMGQRDFYPFALSKQAVDKLRFVDRVIKRSNSRTDIQN